MDYVTMMPNHSYILDQEFSIDHIDIPSVIDSCTDFDIISLDKSCAVGVDLMKDWPQPRMKAHA